MKLNLNNRTFRSRETTSNGEVSDETIFHYKQEGELIWAEYYGGLIEKGFLIGKAVDNHLEFTYQHLNKKLEIMTGKCTSYPEALENGKLKIREVWEWTCKDYSSGKSTIFEI